MERGVQVITLRNLPLPCPANRLYRAFMGPGMKWPRQILSSEARKKRAAVCAAIVAQLRGRPMLTEPMSLHYTITARDRRMPDVDAFEKSILDCLQHAGVVANDRVICHVTKELMPAPQMPGWIDLTLTEVT